jgi:hypothetical protein
MEPKKSQGPSLSTVAGSAVLLCIVLVGVAYFLRDDRQQGTGEQSPPAASTLRAILARCEEGPTEDILDGRTRTRCAAQAHPAFLIEVIGDGEEIDSAKMLMPMQGTTSQVLDRILLGLEMFGVVAGLRADAFLPKEYLDAIGTSKTSLVFQGRVYSTQPIPNVGLIMAVTPADADSAPKN